MGQNWKLQKQINHLTKWAQSKSAKKWMLRHENSGVQGYRPEKNTRHVHIDDLWDKTLVALVLSLSLSLSLSWSLSLSLSLSLPLSLLCEDRWWFIRIDFCGRESSGEISHGFAWAPAEQGLQGIQNKFTHLILQNYIILGEGHKESFFARLVQSSEMSVDILQQSWRIIYDMHPNNLNSILIY